LGYKNIADLAQSSKNFVAGQLFKMRKAHTRVHHPGMGPKENNWILFFADAGANGFTVL
jgi:hypothetical protein